MDLTLCKHTRTYTRAPSHLNLIATASTLIFVVNVTYDMTDLIEVRKSKRSHMNSHLLLAE
jgi:hypothetical protein